MKGIIEINEENNTVHIKEMNVGVWTKDKKEVIDEMIDKNEHIIGLREYHTKNTVHFEIEVSE